METKGFKSEEQEVTEREKIDAIKKLGLDMTKHFGVQEIIRRLQLQLRTTLYITSFLAVLMSGAIMFLILRPPPATQVTLDWVADQMSEISTQKKLNMMDRQDINKAREDYKKIMENANKRDSLSNRRDSIGKKK